MNFMSGRAGFSQEHHHQIITNSTGTSSSSNLHHFPASNGGDDGGAEPSHAPMIEREHMFDKVVTPSDVGKLNRLVIPKQHAEKYFPLDSSTNEKGLLLNFEDRNGKPWRFRYSYWNSSQSYVMTKGWSRFVKEKKLDAGDIVSFQRGLGELGKDRLFIDWRRRPDAPEFPSPILPLPHHFSANFHRSVHPWNPLFLQPPPSPREYLQGSNQFHHHYPYSTTVVNGNPCPPGSVLYLRSSAPVGGGAGLGLLGQQHVGLMQAAQRRSSGVHDQQMVFESVPVVQGKAAAAKRMRLFGVNMEYCPSVSDSDECEMLSHSTTTMPLQQLTCTTTTATHPHFDDSSSSPPPIPSLLQFRPFNHPSQDDKGKGSMSLDLDI